METEKLIAEYLQWRSHWKPTDEEIEGETSYLSKLAEFIAPVPLSRVTKAVMWDFYCEQLRLAPSHEAKQINLHALMLFDVFLKDLRKRRKDGDL